MNRKSSFVVLLSVLAVIFMMTSVVFAANDPIVYNAAQIDEMTTGPNNTSTQMLEVDGVKALEMTVTGSDPSITLKGMNVDLSIYKYFVFNYQITKGNGNSMYPFHLFERSSGAGNTAANGSYGQPLDVSAGGDFKFTGANISLATQDPSATVYTGMRFDYLNGGFATGDKMLIKYIAFFTDKAQFDEMTSNFADDFTLYYGENAPKATEVVAIGDVVEFSVKAPADYIIGGSLPTWYSYTDDAANAEPLTDSLTYSVNTAEIGTTYYFAKYDENNESAHIKVIVCNEEMKGVLADEFGLYRDNDIANEVECVLPEKSVDLTLKGDIDYATGDYTVTWYRNGEELEVDGKKFSVTADMIDVFATYYAVVSDAEGEKVFTSEEVIVCNNEKYREYLATVSDGDYAIYRDGIKEEAGIDVFTGETAVLEVKAPIDFIFGDYTVVWTRGDKVVGETRTIELTYDEATGTEPIVYQVVVKDAEGEVVYANNEIKVYVRDEFFPAKVYYAEDLNKLTASNGTVTVKLVNDNKALELEALKADTQIYVQGLDVDMTIYKYMAIKYRVVNSSTKKMHLYHYFKDSNGTASKSPSENYAQTFGLTAGGYYVASAEIKLAKNPDVDISKAVYTGMRLDYYNDAAIGDKMEIAYIGFFTDNNQLQGFIANDDKVVLPEFEGKYFQFANDENLASKFLSYKEGETDSYAEYVPAEGVKLNGGITYDANIKTRDKFDLSKLGVVKLFYNATEDVNLTITNTAENVVLMNAVLSKDANSAIIDCRNNDAWTGEFDNLKFTVDSALTIKSIGFVATEADADLYNGAFEMATANDELTYSSAKWWSFGNLDVYYTVQAENLSRKYNDKNDYEDSSKRLNTTIFTAIETAPVNFSYNIAHMFNNVAIHGAEKTPYALIGYKSDALEGKKAYFKFIVDETEVVIPFEWPAEGEDKYNGRLLNVGKDDYGYNKLFIDLSSLESLKDIAGEEIAVVEWKKVVDHFEIGTVDAIDANTEIEVAYMNFFKFDANAKDFNGKIKSNPAIFNTAVWNTKDRVIAEYITVKDMDLEAETINFAIADFARVSRLTLIDLQKNNPTKKVVVDGGDYSLEFYPKDVYNDMKTWYYDLEVSFDGKATSDVYYETVKNLITEAEGEYISGVFFHQKFMNDRAMPFKGKLIYNIGEEYNDKYLDIYKYDIKAKAVVLAERAPVKEGKIAISTLGGDLAIVDSGYQPSEEEIKRAEAIDVYENTPWNALIFDFGNTSGDNLVVKAGNSKVTTVTKGGVTYRSIEMTGGDRIQLTLTPNTPFEASEYPVMIVKYKTSVNLSGAVNNYVTTDYYAAGTGYEWFKNGTYYAATGAYTISPSWNTKILNYTNADTMRASGFAINGEYTEGKAANGSVSYPFKGLLTEYRLDFMTSVGTVVDFAYVAFFKNVEEAQKYMEARKVIEGFAEEEAKAEQEAANANKPKFYVFDLTDSKEAAKFTYAGATESQPTKTESKMTDEGLWMKDDDGEFNITRLLGEEEQFELSEYPILKIRVNYSIPGVTSQLYVWNTAQVGTNPRCELLVDKGGEWTEQIWDYSKENMALGTWNGVLTKFRLDPMRGAGRVEREATIAYIGFFKTVEDAEAFDGKIEKK